MAVKLTVPGALVWDGATPLVTFGTIDAAALAAPFLDDALKSMRIEGFRPLDSLAPADRGDTPGMAGAIFHMTRCGSTLMCRQFAALDRVAVLSEPFLFLYLLEGPPAPSAVTTRRLRALAYCWRNALAPVADQYVVKWPLGIGHHAAAILAAFPSVPMIFLHRDPVEILASIAREPLGGMDNAQPWHLGDAAGGDRGTRVEQCARAIATSCRAVARASAVRTIDYAALPEATPALVAPFFGLPPARPAMMAAAAVHSKNADAGQPFRPDSESKQAVAAGRVRALARDVIDPALAEVFAALSPLTPD